VNAWRDAFDRIEPGRPVPVDAIYADEVVFEDPFGRVEGREALRAHFAKLDANLRGCRFEHGPAVVGDGEAMLGWTMHLDLKRGPRRTIVVPGVSHVAFEERVTYQRDYFDAGAMVYEHVPLFGWIVRWIKRLLAP